MASDFCTLEEAKIYSGVAASDSSQNDLLDLLIDLASDEVEAYCNRRFSAKNYTDFISGNGLPDLVVRNVPINSVTSIHLDPNGYWGQGSGAFAAATLLTVGEDYAVVGTEHYESGGLGDSGLIRWLGRGSFNSGTPTGRIGLLTPGISVGGWPVGQGNVKVVYNGGFATVPEAIKLATLMLIQTLKAAKENNEFAITNESLGEYSYSKGQLTYFAREVLGAQEILRRYRQRAV